MDLCPCLFCLSFYLLYFFLPPLKTMGCSSGCLMFSAGIQKLILWNLLSVQMFFWWICGGESGFPVLFLHHLRTTPSSAFKFTTHAVAVLTFYDTPPPVHTHTDLHTSIHTQTYTEDRYVINTLDTFTHRHTHTYTWHRYKHTNAHACMHTQREMHVHIHTLTCTHRHYIEAPMHVPMHTHR